MKYVQLNDIYLNIFTMLIGRSVPGADVCLLVYKHGFDSLSVVSM